MSGERSGELVQSDEGELGGERISDGLGVPPSTHQDTPAEGASPRGMRAERNASADDLCDAIARKLERGQPLSREEVAAFLSVSTKTIQRLESSRILMRCPSLGTVVRYPARDVLRLAMASGRKGA